VRLDLPDVAPDGEHGFERPVTAGGSLVRDQQLRLGRIGQTAVREGRVKENKNHGSR
jgi:hypothetical protein